MSNAQLNKARPNILSTLNGIIAYVPIVIRVAAVIPPLKQQMLFPRENTTSRWLIQSSATCYPTGIKNRVLTHVG